MDTILIAHRDVDFAEQLGWLYPWLTSLNAQGERAAPDRHFARTDQQPTFPPLPFW